MTKTKTILSPEQQWRRSVALASAWTNTVRPAIVELSAIYDLPLQNFALHCREIARIFDHVRERHFARSTRSDWNEYFQFLASRRNEDWTLGRAWHPGISLRNDQRLVKHDLVLVLCSNGTERLLTWAVSSKGRRLCGCYYSTDRLGTKGATIRLLDVPAQLVGVQLADPDAEQYVVGLRAGSSASG